MLRWFNPLPSFNTPESSGAGQATTSPPSEPSVAAPVTTPAPEPAAPAGVEDPATDYMLSAFEAMTADIPDDVVEAPVVETSAPAQPVGAVTTPPQAGTPAAATPPAPVQTAAPTATPATTPAVVPAAVTPPAPQPTITPPSPAAPAVAQPAGGEVVGNSFDQIAEGLAKQKEQFVNVLAEQQYKLSQADLDELVENPAVGYAKLAARAQVEATASVLKVLSQQMPVYVAGLMEARKRNSDAEDSFWTSNPSLDRKAHRETAAQVMKTVRQMHPNMDAPTFIRQVGAITAGLVGVQAATPKAPSGQVVSTPGPVVRQTNGAYQPAGSVTAPPSAHVQQPLSAVEAAFEIFKLDESGAFDSN